MTVYILYSKEIDRYYVGQTQDLAVRLDQHLNKVFYKGHTKQANDWIVYFTITCSSRNQAVQIEAHIKKMKSRKYIDDLKKYPELVEKLKLKYQ
jgi:putative endonuclease